MVQESGFFIDRAEVCALNVEKRAGGGLFQRSEKSMPQRNEGNEGWYWPSDRHQTVLFYNGSFIGRVSIPFERSFSPLTSPLSGNKRSCLWILSCQNSVAFLFILLNIALSPLNAETSPERHHNEGRLPTFTF